MSEAVLAKSRVTRQEYRNLPEGPPHYELIDGELVEMTRPNRAHYQLAGFIVELLRPHVRRVLRGELAEEPNLYLPGIDNVYHPDLAYVPAEQRRICREDGIQGVPEMVCEILSPSTEQIDRHVKLADYRRAGVRYAWLIDPRRPVAVEEFVLLDDGTYRTHTRLQTPEIWQPLAFPGWEISLAEMDAEVTPVDESGPSDAGTAGNGRPA
jgi:Uma2 family endonuclease